MPKLRQFLAALGMTLLVAACADSTAPVSESPLFAKGGNRVSLEPTVLGEDVLPESDLGDVVDGAGNVFTLVVPEGTIAQAPLAPELQSYHHEFQVEQGKRASYAVLYTTLDVFMDIDVPASAQLVDDNGRRLKRGERVTVHIDIDPVSFAVRFLPHGITFPQKPADLTFGLTFADWSDHPIRDANDLTMWYQPVTGTDWTELDNAVEFEFLGLWAHTTLDHFSNYAIAW